MSEPGNEPLEIVLPLDVSQIRQVEQATRAVQKLADATDQAGQSARYAQGPYQALSRIEAQVARAQQQGAPDAVWRDLRLAHQRATSRVARLEAPPPTSSQRILQAISTSRFSVGGGGIGVQPLIGRTAAALAEGTSGGPAGIALAAIASAAVATASELNKVAAAAADTSRGFAHLRNVGGSRLETGALASVGSALGMSPGQISGLAQGIQGRITSDPFAMNYAAQMGVRNLPGALGDQNYARQLLRVAEGLARIQDRQERLRTARALGAEELLPYANLSGATRRRLGRDAEANSAIFGPQQDQLGAEYDAAAGRLKSARDRLNAVSSRRLLDLAADALNYFADSLSEIADFVAFSQREGFLKALVTPKNQMHGANAAAGAAGGRPGGGYDPLAENSAALERNTFEVSKLRQTFSAGERANSALTPGVKDALWWDANTTMGLRLSGF